MQLCLCCPVAAAARAARGCPRGRGWGGGVPATEGHRHLPALPGAAFLPAPPQPAPSGAGPEPAGAGRRRFGRGGAVNTAHSDVFGCLVGANPPASLASKGVLLSGPGHSRERANYD